MVKKSKVRLLTKTLAVVSLLAPASGYTLGIGEIKLHSALNQNLDAEISLTLSGENLSDIKVNLAPPEKFDEAGVSWAYFLSKIKFETLAKSNSSAVIKLTSKEALKEPFLDFLLEVSWPKGNLYREFTVLVDPPAVYNQTAISASAGTERYAPTAKPHAVGQSPHAGGQSTGSEYGPTLANDTLWSVAERVRGQSDVSVEQMMMAIFQANPQAFSKGNVFALTTGKMLKIPGRDAVLKLSKNQALDEFNRHKKAWRTQEAPVNVVEIAKKKPSPSKTGDSVDNQLTLLAPSKAAVSDHAVVASGKDQINAEKKTADASPAASKIVKGKAADAGDSVAADDGAVQGKIAALEKQLAMMQELIALKDQQLAALQKRSEVTSDAPKQVIPNELGAVKPANQVATAPQPTVAQPVTTGEIVAAKPAAQSTPAPQSAIAQPAQPVAGEVTTAKPLAQTIPAPQQAVVQPTQPVTGDVATNKPADQTTTAPAQAVVQQPKPVQPVVQPEQPKSTNLFDPYYLGLGGVGMAILALLGWLWWKKRKIDEETNTESMFASSMLKTPEIVESPVAAASIVEDAATVVHDAGTVGESSFLSEFTPSDFDSFDTDQGEIDPISEADVYLAYGRYQQAEELIRQAIKDQPNRDECKLKLLEIFYANENKTAFEAYANELVAIGKRNEAEFWEQAAEMGREICPGSPLFCSGDDLFAVADDSTAIEHVGVSEELIVSGGVNLAKNMAELDNDNSDADVSFSEPEAEVGSFETLAFDSPIDDQRNNQDIDFDLATLTTSDDREKSTVENAASTAQIDDFDFDFDLSALPIEAKETDEAVVAVQSATPTDLDFDLSSFSTDVKESDVADKEIAASLQVEDFDFDLNSFSVATSESGEVSQDFSASEVLPEPSSTISEGDNNEFESYEFDFDAIDSGAKGDLDFSILEDDGKKHQDVDADRILDFNSEDLAGDFDFNFDLDMPLRSAGQDSLQQGEFGVSDLTDMDELETKLDLAKAYVDMGDAEAAKDLAREVLTQGTDKQKKVAQALLDELG